MKQQRNEKGYTLIELLAVIFILVAVGTIIASILTSVLRSSNKSTNTETVRANGNFAIAQMSRMIAYAQKIEGISIDDPNISPNHFITDCVSQTPGTKYYYLKLKAFDSGTTTFACADSKIASRSGDIVDPNFVTYLVNPSLIAKCYFQCSQESAAAPAKIDIFLDLSAVSTAVFAESQATMHFETSVIARNNTTR